MKYTTMKNIISKLIIAIFAMLIGVSCTKTETFKLDGTVSDVPEGEVYMYRVNNNKIDTLAYTTFKDGTFQFDSLRIPIHEPTYATIILRPKRSDDPTKAITYKRIPLVLDNNHLTAKFEMASYDQVIEGSNYHTQIMEVDRSNEEVVALNKKYHDDFESFQVLRRTSKDKEFVKKTGEEVNKTYKMFTAKKQELILEKLAQSEDPVFKSFLLVHNAYIMEPAAFVEQATRVLEEAEGLNSSIASDLNGHKVRYENQLKAEVGKPFTDFSINNMDGTSVTLSDVVQENEYVLLDFWASWCAPCRAEVPNLKKAYEEFNPKGFGIYMVSIDNDKSKWEAASIEEKFPWTNALDRNGVQKSYAVNFIPQNFLIDKNGTIVAKNLRGEKLEEKLEELLSE